MTITPATRAEVVQRARAQVGKSYQFGAVGPDAYDCSGSTSGAWYPELALPHNSGAQVKWFASGTQGSQLLLPGRTRGRPNRTYLEPGDLVFYYGDPRHNPDTVSHVAIYVGKESGTGRRMIVNATNEQRGVELITIDAYARPSAFGLVGHRV